MFGFRRQAAGTGAILVLVIIAWVSLEIGHTFGTALTIFSVLVWAAVALTFAYMVLFRGVKLKLFRDDEAPLDGSPEYFEVPAGELVEVREGDVIVRGDRDA